jgi:prophage regulatory protein
MDLQTLSRIYSPTQLRDLTGLSLATIWRLRQRGELPAPIQLSPGRVGWSEDTVRQWLAARAAATK